MLFFAKRWEYKESLIRQNSYRNIYAILEDDERQANLQREKQGLPEKISKTELLTGDDCTVNDEYLLCLYLSGGDILKADNIYTTMDIVDVFEKQAYKLAFEYGG